MHRVADSVCDGIRFAIPQPTEWQHMRNEIDAAMIFGRADFVNIPACCSLSFGLVLNNKQ